MNKTSKHKDYKMIINGEVKQISVILEKFNKSLKQALDKQAEMHKKNPLTTNK